MRNCVLVSMAACLSLACGSGDGGESSSGPLGAIAGVYGAGPEPEPVFGSASPPSFPPSTVYGEPAQSPYARGPSALQVEGHLEGQLRDIPLSGDTTDNYGTVETWPNRTGYLNASVALGTPAGAGMIILNVNGGLGHPVFSEGRWSSGRELAFQLSPAYTGEQAISVSSCAGPVIGDWPYEQQAVNYDMSVETDPEAPETTVIVVGATFLVDGLSAETNEVSATIRFVNPD